MKNPFSFFALAATLCAFLSLASLVFAAWFPIMAALVFIASAFTSRRLKPGDALINVWRAAFILVTAWLFWEGYNGENSAPPEVLLAWSLARVAAGEIALRSWIENGFAGEKKSLQTLLPALVIMGASNTFDAAWPKFFVPIWFGLTLLSLGSTVEFDRTASKAKRARGLRLLLCGLVVVCGFALHVTVLLNRYEIARVGAKLLGEKFAAEATGLSTKPQLGATFGAEGSLTRVLRIENLRGGESYFRAMSFDIYQKGAWLPATDTRSNRTISSQELTKHAQNGGETVRVQRLIDDEGLLFAPLDVAQISAPDAELKWARGGPLQSQDPAPDPFFYDLKFASQPNFQGPLCEKPTAPEMAKLLQVPAEIPLQARFLAQQIAGGLEPTAQIRAIEDYLQAHHAYSLSTDPGTGDPLANFIGSDKAAHCEYFASAAVVMLRSVGLPARYCVGYYVHEKDGDATIVRLRDAHAWAECYVAGVGWINVEATPGGARPDKRSEPVPFWRKLRERIQDAAMAMRHFVATLSASDRRLMGIGIGVLALATACGIWLRGRKIKRGAPESFAYSARENELNALARRFERWLRRANRKVSGEKTLDQAKTWRAVLRREPRRLESSHAREWLDRYNRARWGQSDEIARLRQLLHALENETKNSKKETS